MVKESASLSVLEVVTQLLAQLKPCSRKTGSYGCGGKVEYSRYVAYRASLDVAQDEYHFPTWLQLLQTLLKNVTKLRRTVQ